MTKLPKDDLTQDGRDYINRVRSDADLFVMIDRVPAPAPPGTTLGKVELVRFLHHGLLCEITPRPSLGRWFGTVTLPESHAWAHMGVSTQETAGFAVDMPTLKVRPIWLDAERGSGTDGFDTLSAAVYGMALIADRAIKSALTTPLGQSLYDYLGRPKTASMLIDDLNAALGPRDGHARPVMELTRGVAEPDGAVAPVKHSDLLMEEQMPWVGRVKFTSDITSDYVLPHERIRVGSGDCVDEPPSFLFSAMTKHVAEGPPQTGASEERWATLRSDADRFAHVAGTRDHRKVATAARTALGILDAHIQTLLDAPETAAASPDGLIDAAYALCSVWAEAIGWDPAAWRDRVVQLLPRDERAAASVTPWDDAQRVVVALVGLARGGAKSVPPPPSR